MKPDQLELFPLPTLAPPAPAPSAEDEVVSAAETTSPDTDSPPKRRLKFLPLDHPERPRNRGKDKS